MTFKTADLFDETGHYRRTPGRWDADPGEMLDREDFLRVLADCLSGLPERQAEVFALRVLDERAPEDVCGILDVTRTNLGVLLHRARTKLRSCLEANWFAED